MLTTQEIAGRQLAWVRAKGLRERYELRAGGAETPLAVLTLRGSGGEAEIEGTTYHFTRSGWLRWRMVVRADSRWAPVAVFSAGALEIAGGATYLWKKPRFWTNERDWVDAAGQVLVRMQPVSARKVHTILDPAARETTDLMLLVVLGELLLALANQDAWIAAVSTVVGA